MSKTNDRLARFCKEFPGVLTICAHFLPELMNDSKLRDSVQLSVETADPQLMFYRGSFDHNNIVGGKPFMEPFHYRRPPRPENPHYPGSTGSRIERIFAVDRDNCVVNEHTWMQYDDFIVRDVLSGRSGRLYAQYLVRTVSNVWSGDGPIFGKIRPTLAITVYKQPRLGSNDYTESFPALADRANEAEHLRIKGGSRSTSMFGPGIGLGDSLYKFADTAVSALFKEFVEWSDTSGLKTLISTAARFGNHELTTPLGDVQVISTTWKETRPESATVELRRGEDWLLFHIDLFARPGGWTSTAFKGMECTLASAQSIFATVKGLCAQCGLPLEGVSHTTGH